MMRVLMVTRETAEDRRYGLGKSLAPLFEPLRALGADVRYFCQEDMPADAPVRRQRRLDRIARLPGLRGRPHRINLAQAWLERLQIGRAAAQVAAEEGYTHVHAHDPWLACGVAWGLKRSGHAAIRWGFTQHGFGSYSQATHEDGLLQGPAAQAWLRRIERAIAARARWVMAPTDSSLAQLARDLGLGARPPHWHAISHARPRLAPAPRNERDAARAARGWTPREKVVLGVGRLVPLKCFDRLIRACAAQRDPDLRLLLVGGGDASGLRALAADLGFADQLRLEVADDVSPCYAAADVYVSASATEAFGMANLEALCAGLPALCSAVGGVPEVVADGGWLVPNDLDTLTHSLRALLADEAFRQGWAQRALARAAQWPDATTIAQRYVAIYQAA